MVWDNPAKSGPTASPFDGVTTNDIEAVLSHLESKLPMLEEDDQMFVQGCRMHITTGAPLTAQNQQRLRNIAKAVKLMDHNAMGFGEPLSMEKVIQEIASKPPITQQEADFLNEQIRLLQAKLPLEPNSIQRLLNMHKAKGF